MNTVGPTSKVRLHYRIRLEDGTVVESSYDRRPLEFTMGQQMVLPAFEQALLGLREGETRTFVVPPECAYGEYRADRVIEMRRGEIGSHLSLRAGTTLPIRLPSGSVAEVRIVRVTPQSITVDANHPLAGKKLIFEVTLLKILDS